MINRLYNYFIKKEIPIINPKEIGAVVIDMQPGRLRSISKHDREKLFTSQKETLEICAERDYPIAVLEYDTYTYGETEKRIAEIIKNAPRHIFLEKDENDGFSRIEKQINEWGLKDLCFMGISAAYCVKATASSARSNGKRILTARELIASQTFRQKEFKKCIPWFERNGIYFSKYEELITLLTSSHEHPSEGMVSKPQPYSKHYKF